MYNLMIYCILKIFFLQLKSDNKALYLKWTTFKCNVKQINTFPYASYCNLGRQVMLYDIGEFV